MTKREKTPDEIADELLTKWATAHKRGKQHPGEVLRENGILNNHRLRHIERIEIPMSSLIDTDKPREDQ
jgi:hypothetical protein